MPDIAIGHTMPTTWIADPHQRDDALPGQRCQQLLSYIRSESPASCRHALAFRDGPVALIVVPPRCARRGTSSRSEPRCSGAIGDSVVGIVQPGARTGGRGFVV